MSNDGSLEVTSSSSGATPLRPPMPMIMDEQTQVEVAPAYDAVRLRTPSRETSPYRGSPPSGQSEIQRTEIQTLRAEVSRLNQLLQVQSEQVTYVADVSSELQFSAAQSQANLRTKAAQFAQEALGRHA